MIHKELFRANKPDKRKRKKSQVDIEAEKNNKELPFEEDIVIDIDRTKPYDLL
jgi:hypothetical protein